MQLDKPCKIWTGTKNHDGYGIRKGWDGDRRINIRVHREVCEKTHGKPRGKKTDAMHLCNNRACYEETHVQWGTRWQNMQHAIAAGTVPRMLGETNGNSKLTAASIRVILSYKDERTKDTRKNLAKTYGISPQTVSKIWLGQRWRHL